MRVVGPILMTDQRIDEMGRIEVPQWRGAITGGIWQDVWIQRRGSVTIHDVFLKPDIDKSQTGIDLELYNHQSAQQKLIKFCILLLERTSLLQQYFEQYEPFFRFLHLAL